MANLRILILIMIVSLIGVILFSRWNKPSVLTPEIITDSKYAIGNNATHMTGCKVLSRSVPKKVIYEPVAKRFINLPCALEVPPPFSVLAFARRGGALTD